MEITRAYLEENHPDLVASIRNEGTEAGRAEGHAAGREEERERILGIQQIPAAGFEELQQELMADPSITRGEAALRILDAKGQQEERRKQSAKDDLDQDEAAVGEVLSPAAEGTVTEEAEQDAAIANVVAQVQTFQTLTANQ